jgi:hypothetical protein
MNPRWNYDYLKLKYLSRFFMIYSEMEPNTNDDAAATAAVPPAKLQTEDTGKILEKAICDAYSTPFVGAFQYSQHEVDKLTPRLRRLSTDNLFPMCVHTASKGARYDFTAVAGESGGEVLHLSAKSNKKKGGKLAPQVVGQATPQKFWEEFLQFTNGSNDMSPVTDPATLKKYIQENIAAIMPMLWRYTFDSPIVYYVRDTDQIRFIAPVVGQQPDWTSFQYSWSRPYDKWTNSTSLRVVMPGGGGGGGDTTTIMEFQFHTKSRQNMAVRWAIDKVLQVFAGHFKVTNL